MKTKLDWVAAYEKLQRENAVLKASERKAKETSDALFAANRRIADLESELFRRAIDTDRYLFGPR